jgi:hypothetical protein
MHVRMETPARRFVNLPGEMKTDLRQRIFSIKTAEEFGNAALEIFRYQAIGNPVYKQYIDALGIEPDSVQLTGEIPFLPVAFFKGHKIITPHRTPQAASRTPHATRHSPRAAHRVRKQRDDRLSHQQALCFRPDCL